MELHYYKFVFEEGAEYLTWDYIGVDVIHYRVGIVGSYEKGWTKKKVPNFTSSQVKEAAHWFSMSNMEDQHFIEMERLYCNMYLDKELKDIERSEPHNQELIKKFVNK